VIDNVGVGFDIIGHNWRFSKKRSGLGEVGTVISDGCLTT